MRLDPAVDEVRVWIEDILREELPSVHLLEALKNGVALCKLINLVIAPLSVKFKQSTMPFVQMENISVFLHACQAPPLNLHQQDTFLTVDLFEQKNPAKVLQCLGAFSRAAHKTNPSRFPDFIGPRGRGGSVVRHQGTDASTRLSRIGRGTIASSTPSACRPEPVSLLDTGDAASSIEKPTKGPIFSRLDSTAQVSSWSKREHEGVTSPAWSIAQYGYMGGANQGNLGVAFGARRQITGNAFSPSSPVDKEHIRRRQKAQEKLPQGDKERARTVRIQSEEERLREKETREQQEEVRRKAVEEKWSRQKQKKQLITDESHRKEKREAENSPEAARCIRPRRSDAEISRQICARDQSAQKEAPNGSQYSDRVKYIEKELELARQREVEYKVMRLRESKGTNGVAKQIGEHVGCTAEQDVKAHAWSSHRAAVVPRHLGLYLEEERQLLQAQWTRHHEELICSPRSLPRLPHTKG